MMIRSHVLCIAAAMALGVVTAPAFAEPSFFGYTGLVRVPTADALYQQDFNAAFFAIDVDGGADLTNFAANYGLLDGLEIGFARLKPEGASADTLINGKYRIAPGDGRSPAVAAGVIDILDELDATAYVVVSAALGKDGRTDRGDIGPARLHVGAGGGQLDGFFGGVSLGLGQSLLLMLEYDSDDFNAGGQIAFGNRFLLHVATLDGFDDFGAGVSYNQFF